MLIVNSFLLVAREDYRVGICGSNVGYQYLIESRVLHIYGRGDMASFNDDTPQPWRNWKNEIAMVVIHDGITSVGERAFQGCENLKSVLLEEGVSSICDYAFSFCIGMTSIELPQSLKVIGEDAFRSTLLLDTIRYNGDVSDWCSINHTSSEIFAHAKEVFFNGERLTSVVISSEIACVKDYAFDEANFMDTLTLSYNTHIGVNSFTHIYKPVKLQGKVGGIQKSNSWWTLEKGTLIINQDGIITNDTSWLRYEVFIDSIIFQGNNISITFFGDRGSLMNVHSCTMPINTLEINPLFFRMCSHLDQIILYAINPPNVIWPQWMDLPPKELKIIVPESSVNKYRNHYFWGNFDILSDFL